MAVLLYLTSVMCCDSISCSQNPRYDIKCRCNCYRCLPCLNCGYIEEPMNSGEVVTMKWAGRLAGRILTMTPRSHKKTDPNPWERLKQGAAMGEEDPWDKFQNKPCVEEDEDTMQSERTSARSGQSEPEELDLEPKKKKEDKSVQGAGLIKSTTSGCSIQ